MDGPCGMKRLMVKEKNKKGTYGGKNCKREHKCFSPLLSDICIDPPRKLVFF